MSSHKKQSVGISVGIRELKDRASEIIATVQRTGRAISITKNHQEVARITAIPTDPHERLVAAGLVRPGPKPRPISELKLTPLGVDSSRAVRAILQDREED
jgi:antitoxin (DNA-binding transcriptional repressor) of toxin-antitoxin stability system